MAQTQYSIAEARDKFTALIRDVEKTSNTVEVTRHGQPVVVILSSEEYARLQGTQKQQNLAQTYQSWREKWLVDQWEDETDPFADIRDKSTGREIDL